MENQQEQEEQKKQREGSAVNIPQAINIAKSLSGKNLGRGAAMQVGRTAATTAVFSNPWVLLAIIGVVLLVVVVFTVIGISAGPGAPSEGQIPTAETPIPSSTLPPSPTIELSPTVTIQPTIQTTTP